MRVKVSQRISRKYLVVESGLKPLVCDTCRKWGTVQVLWLGSASGTARPRMDGSEKLQNERRIADVDLCCPGS
jgi:hypothetical protein